MKAVFDTNVLIAAFLTEGICAKLLIRARRRDFDMILCDGILQDFKRVLKKKFAASPHEMSEALLILSAAAQDIIGQTDPIVPICRDSDDDLILACARDAVADYVVTGDEDLLVLKDYEGISILNPREFEKLFPD
ncbi:MAG: putative toxin-antitoxin system toxin component, PIN family [Deltaproteobacteria bacterium]|nr:putative toxin-antitoxin system toxin component, PIN family [Deltaproteobacteria bacterium]